MKFVAVLLLLAGCAGLHMPARTTFENASYAAVADAWKTAGMPTPSAGCRIDLFAVKTPDEDGYRDLCSSEPSKSFACMHMSSEGRPLHLQSVPWVVIAPWYHSEPHIIVHELLHAFQRCAGVYDASHQSSKVWAEPGGETSVQARAEELLRAGGWL